MGSPDSSIQHLALLRKKYIHIPTDELARSICNDALYVGAINVVVGLEVARQGVREDIWFVLMSVPALLAILFCFLVRKRIMRLAPNLNSIFALGSLHIWMPEDELAEAAHSNAQSAALWSSFMFVVSLGQIGFGNWLLLPLSSAALWLSGRIIFKIRALGYNHIKPQLEPRDTALLRKSG